MKDGEVTEERLESRVAEWVCTRIGESHMHPQERALRLLEEAAELAQAEGVTAAQAQKQVGYVFSRPSGDPPQEAGGVAVCLLGWCAATGNTFDAIARREIERIEAKPVEEIRGSLARKDDQDLVSHLTTGWHGTDYLPLAQAALKTLRDWIPMNQVMALDQYILDLQRRAESVRQIKAVIDDLG